MQQQDYDAALLARWQGVAPRLLLHLFQEVSTLWRLRCNHIPRLGLTPSLYQTTFHSSGEKIMPPRRRLNKAIIWSLTPDYWERRYRPLNKSHFSHSDHKLPDQSFNWSDEHSHFEVPDLMEMDNSQSTAFSGQLSPSLVTPEPITPAFQGQAHAGLHYPPLSTPEGTIKPIKLWSIFTPEFRNTPPAALDYPPTPPIAPP
jgi:hypothetical protein